MKTVKMVNLMCGVVLCANLLGASNALAAPERLARFLHTPTSLELIMGVNGNNVELVRRIGFFREEVPREQQWIFTRTGNYYYIKNVGTNQCLDVRQSSMENGANVMLYRCTLTDNQLFSKETVYYSSGRIKGYMFRAKHSGKCLDVVASGRREGTNVAQYTCHPEWDNQIMFTTGLASRP